jgi:hypothetical protein
MKMPDAAERKVLMITTFVSGCIALMPQEWVSAVVLLLASGLMFLGERRLARRAKAAMGTRFAAAPEPLAEVAPPVEEVAMLAAEAAPHAESAAPPPRAEA